MFEIKEYISQLSGLSHDALHVHIGLAIYLLSRTIFQGRGGAIISCCLVFLVALLSEMSDLVINDGLISSHEPDHLSDIIATSFWPTLLCSVALLKLRGIRVSLPPPHVPSIVPPTTTS